MITYQKFGKISDFLSLLAHRMVLCAVNGRWKNLSAGQRLIMNFWCSWELLYKNWELVMYENKESNCTLYCFFIGYSRPFAFYCNVGLIPSACIQIRKWSFTCHLLLRRCTANAILWNGCKKKKCRW